VSETRGDRSVAMLLSILVHAAIAGLLGFGWWHFRKPVEPLRQLAIEATVVTATEAAPASTTDTQAAAIPAAAPAAPVAPPEPPAPVAEPRPEPKPDAAQAEQIKRAAAEKREAAQREEAERERTARAERERRETEQRETERRETERREAEQRQRESEQRAAAQKVQAAAEQAAKLKAQQAAQDKARREAELHAQLASEERINAARSSAAMASYVALITSRINRAWIRPPSVRAGLSCELRVTQVPGGEVTGVQIGSCNGDQAARESIEAAVYRASPLPTPSNPDLFDRNLTIRFHPDE